MTTTEEIQYKQLDEFIDKFVDDIAIWYEIIPDVIRYTFKWKDSQGNAHNIVYIQGLTDSKMNHDIKIDNSGYIRYTEGDNIDRIVAHNPLLQAISHIISLNNLIRYKIVYKSKLISIEFYNLSNEKIAEIQIANILYIGKYYKEPRVTMRYTPFINCSEEQFLDIISKRYYTGYSNLFLGQFCISNADSEVFNSRINKYGLGGEIILPPYISLNKKDLLDYVYKNSCKDNKKNIPTYEKKDVENIGEYKLNKLDIIENELDVMEKKSGRGKGNRYFFYLIAVIIIVIVVIFIIILISNSMQKDNLITTLNK